MALVRHSYYGAQRHQVSPSGVGSAADVDGTAVCDQRRETQVCTKIVFYLITFQSIIL